MVDTAAAKTQEAAAESKAATAENNAMQAEKQLEAATIVSAFNPLTGIMQGLDEQTSNVLSPGAGSSNETNKVLSNAVKKANAVYAATGR